MNLTPNTPSASATHVADAADWAQNIANEFHLSYWVPSTTFAVADNVLTISGADAVAELTSLGALTDATKAKISRTARPSGLPYLTASVDGDEITLTLSDTHTEGAF